MPRRRLTSSDWRFCIGSNFLFWGVGRQLGKYRTRGLDFVTNGHPRTRARRQIDVYPRAKANEAIALACIHFIARLGITENAFGDQAGYLDGGDHMPAGRAQHHGVALVLE